MAFYQGRPVDACEMADEEGGALGVDLHKSGNCWYKLVHNSASIYSLDRSREPVSVLPARVGDPVSQRFRNPYFNVSNEDLTDPEYPGSSFYTNEEPTASPPIMYWEECRDGDVPSGAVYVSEDRDGGSLYVGRAYIFGALIPGKVAVRHRVCYVALEGKEFAMGTYEVLVVKRGGVKWVPSREGYLPPYALPAGYNLRGDTIYSAKAKCEEIDTPGHFIPADKKCCISFNVEEHCFTEFDVLTIDPEPKSEERSSK